MLPHVWSYSAALLQLRSIVRISSLLALRRLCKSVRKLRGAVALESESGSSWDLTVFHVSINYWNTNTA